jgi:hypothetical protein
MPTSERENPWSGVFRPRPGQRGVILAAALAIAAGAQTSTSFYHAMA